MATITLTNKDIASLSLTARHGRDLVLNDIKNLTFSDILFDDGVQVKNVTFNQIQNEVWTLSNKTTAVLTLPSKS